MTDEDSEYSKSTEKVLDTLGSDFTPPKKREPSRTYYPPTTYDSYNYGYYDDPYEYQYDTKEDTEAIAKAYILMFDEDPSIIGSILGSETLKVTIEIVKQLTAERGDRNHV